jgi:hypothetical protein
VPREQEDEHLVADLRVGERLAVVARGDQQPDQVLCAVRRGAARLDELVADVVERLLRVRRAPVRGRRPGARWARRVVCAPPRVLAEDREGRLDDGQRAIDLRAEQQAPDHAQREARDLGVHVDGLARARPAPAIARRRPRPPPPSWPRSRRCACA